MDEGGSNERILYGQSDKAWHGNKTYLFHDLASDMSSFQWLQLADSNYEETLTIAFFKNQEKINSTLLSTLIHRLDWLKEVWCSSEAKTLKQHRFSKTKNIMAKRFHFNQTSSYSVSIWPKIWICRSLSKLNKIN